MITPNTLQVYDMPYVHPRPSLQHTVTQYRTLVGVLSEGRSVCVLTYTENCAVKIQDFTTGIVGWLG